MNFLNTEWFAIQEFWGLLHQDVGKKFVRVAKSKVKRENSCPKRGSCH